MMNNDLLVTTISFRLKLYMYFNTYFEDEIS